MFLTHPIQLTAYCYGPVANTDFEHSTNRKSPDEIINTVAKYFSLDVKELTSKKRLPDLVAARNFCMSYLYCMCPRLSLVDIGKLMGGRDHTTVIHGKETVKDRTTSKADDVYKIYERDLSSILRISFYEHIHAVRVRSPRKQKNKIVKMPKLNMALIKSASSKPVVNTVVNLTPPLDRKSFTTYSNRQFVF